MAIYLIVALICGGVAAAVASNADKSGGLWFVLGFLFGPLGVLAAFIVASD